MKFPWFIWIPRALMILLILFMAMFSIDVFDEPAPLGRQLIGLFMHNIPALILLAILLLTWKHPLIGGVFFGVAAAAFSLWVGIYFTKHFWVDMLAFTLPMAVVSGLFILAHVLAKRRPNYGSSQSESAVTQGTKLG